MVKRIDYLLQQFESGKLTESENEELLRLTDTESELVSNAIANKIAAQEEFTNDFKSDSKWESLLQNVVSVDKIKLPKRTKLIPTLRWIAAAIILLAVSITFYFYNYTSEIKKEHVFLSDALPGKNKATLTLADGKKISLTDAIQGDIAKQAGLSITKTADGQLVYNIAENTNHEDDSKVNTISTPKGGQWQVRLPDGSIVWLNAASSLTYPLSFVAAKHRVVELTGEAYFEVAKDKLHPFIVKTSKQEVEVLGTYFNINCYEDEFVTKTTLLEGSVRVSHNDNHDTEILKPGEQSVVSNKGISISSTDVEESVAWKNGYFMFNNEKQESIMRKISRWYNIEIEYADPAAKEVMYYGTVSRFEKVSQVLRKLEQTGEVRFEIKNNKIFVYKEDKKK